MSQNIYKHQHPLHGNVYLKIIGNNFTFFSLEKSQPYGKKITFTNKTDLMEKINNSFYYHPDTFTLDKAIKYIGVDTFGETKEGKEEQDEPPITAKKSKTEFPMEDVPVVPFSNITEMLSNDEILSLMKTSKTMYNFLFLVVANRLYMKHSLFLNNVLFINKDQVKNLNIDVITMGSVATLGKELLEYKNLVRVKVKNSLLPFVYKRLTELRIIELTVEFYNNKGNPADKMNSLTLNHIPVYVRKLTILDENNRISDFFPLSTIKFSGELKTEKLIEFSCGPKIDVEFPNLKGVEIIKIQCDHLISGSYRLPDSTIEAKFNRYCEGPITLPQTLKKLTVSHNYKNSIMPLPPSLEYLHITVAGVQRFAILTDEYGEFINNLHDNLKDVTFVSEIYLNSDVLITKVPKNIEKLILNTEYNAIDFEHIVFPKSLKTFFLSLTGDEEVVRNWPKNLEKLTIRIGDRNEIEIRDLPDSLLDIEFVYWSAFKVEYPKNLKRLTAKLDSIVVNDLPASVEYLKITGVTKLENVDVKFPRSLKTLAFRMTENDSVYLPDSLNSLYISYDESDEIVIPKLPNDLENLSLSLRTFNVFINYSNENQKNIKHVEIMVPEEFFDENEEEESEEDEEGEEESEEKKKKKEEKKKRKEEKVEEEIRDLIKGLTPHGVEFLTIKYRNHNHKYYGIDLLTREYPSLQKLKIEYNPRYRGKSSNKTIFLFGKLFIPLAFDDPLENLRDDITYIEFEKGSTYGGDFTPPILTEYMRLPKGYPGFHKWDDTIKGQIRIVFNDE